MRHYCIVSWESWTSQKSFPFIYTLCNSNLIYTLELHPNFKCIWVPLSFLLRTWVEKHFPGTWAVLIPSTEIWVRSCNCASTEHWVPSDRCSPGGICGCVKQCRIQVRGLLAWTLRQHQMEQCSIVLSSHVVVHKIQVLLYESIMHRSAN